MLAYSLPSPVWSKATLLIPPPRKPAGGSSSTFVQVVPALKDSYRARGGASGGTELPPTDVTPCSPSDVPISRWLEFAGSIASAPIDRSAASGSVEGISAHVSPPLVDLYR